jgi:hypothetical protein
VRLNVSSPEIVLNGVELKDSGVAVLSRIRGLQGDSVGFVTSAGSSILWLNGTTVSVGSGIPMEVDVIRPRVCFVSFGLLLAALLCSFDALSRLLSPLHRREE